MDCAVLPLEAPLVIRAAGVRRGARGGAAFEAGGAVTLRDLLKAFA